MTFDLTEEEWKRVKRWYKTKHAAKHKNNQNGWKFVITPTGIGDAIEVVCKDCQGHVLDLTDYDTW